MTVTVPLDPEIEARLEALARATGRPVASHIQEAIAEHLDDLEDAALAERELSEVRAGRSDVLPLDEVMRRHGLDG